MAGAKYVVLQPLKHDGKRYAIGESVTLGQKAGDALVDAGVLQRAAEASEVKATKAQLEALAAAEAAEEARKAAEAAEEARKLAEKGDAS